MLVISNLINTWEEHKDNHHNDTIYTSDIDFFDHYKLVNTTEYIADILEYLEGEHGLVLNNFQYENEYNIKGPIYIDFEKKNILTLDNAVCINTDTLNNYKLTIYNKNYFITTSQYLKPICVILFSICKNMEGLNYIFNNLLSYISYILPNYIIQIKPFEYNKISLPFSISFIDQLNITNLIYYHSQLDNTIYTICQTHNTAQMMETNV